MASNVNFQKLMAALLEAVPTDLPDALVERWLNHPDTLSEVLRRALEKFPECVVSRYTVSVDYNLPLEVMIKSGLYGYVDPNITAENFPSDKIGKKQITVYFVKFDHSISSKDALEEIYRQELCPITIRELLALGTDYADELGEYPVAALGSIWTSSFLSNSRKYVPCFGKDGFGKYLINNPVDTGWGKHWYFAAMRK